MSDSAAMFTDRQHLVTQAYADSANLNARAALYHYQQPRIQIVEWALGHLPWRGDETVLDVGCGPGRYLRRLAQQHAGMRLIGMDLSRGMLADLARGWGTAQAHPLLAVADAQSIPLPDASCDVALAMHMLYHVPDIARAASELRRVLRPGGTLLAITNGARHTRELNELYQAALAQAAGQAPEEERWSSRFNLENGAELLGRAFEHVERRDAASALEIPAPGPALAYLDSIRATREPSLPPGVAWEAVLAEAERIVSEIIASKGIFRVQSQAGMFICR
jgi:ubiquinone/menaquinone biosynthesis C-methylase UbiE